MINNSKNRIIWIDAIRSLCVVWIVCYWHIVDYCSLNIFAIRNGFTIQFTYCVLATFTIISGFFAYSDKLNSKNDILYFYLKKLLKIYPLFTVAGILFVLIGYNNLTSFVNSELGVGSFVAPYPLTLWFICMIYIFYFITPFVKIFGGGNKYRSVFAVVFIEVFFWLTNRFVGSDERLYFYWMFFGAGILIRKNGIINQVKGKTNVIIPTLILYVVMSFLIGENFDFVTIIYSVLFIILISNISYSVFGKQDRNRMITFLSCGSMCAYLFHRPILYWLQSKWGTADDLATYILFVTIVFVVSWGIQKLYDRFLQKTLNRIRKN